MKTTAQTYQFEGHSFTVAWMHNAPIVIARQVIEYTGTTRSAVSSLRSPDEKVLLTKSDFYTYGLTERVSVNLHELNFITLKGLKSLLHKRPGNNIKKLITFIASLSVPAEIISTEPVAENDPEPDADITAYNYNGNNVSFRLSDNSLMINATEMAKPFGKNFNEWKRLPSTIKFITALNETKGKSRSLIDTIEGRNGGSWIHEDLALEFARWLDPRFAIWCNDRVKELLKFGVSATPQAMDKMIADPDFAIRLLTNLKQERAEKEALKIQTEIQAKELRIAAPKVDYYDKVLLSNSLIPVTLIASELNMSAVRLNQMLYQLGIQYKVNGSWVLYWQYRDKDYARPKTHTYTDSTGKIQTVMNLYWTQKGREFIHQLINKSKSA